MLNTPPRPSTPPKDADERAMLTSFLEYQRVVFLRKLAGLDEEQLRVVGTPSGLTLLGMLKHLAYVERWWFRVLFAGEDLPLAWSEEDRDADWRADAHDRPKQLLSFYEAEVERVREIVSAASLDDRAVDPRAEEATLRWILFHMLEEYARHLGHADLMREAIDGRTGFEG